MATEISTWDELLATAVDSETEITWTGGDLNFDEIQPHGFTETITLKAKSIDFQNATFKNFRSFATTAIHFNFVNKDSVLKNLSLIDMTHNPEKTNSNVLCEAHVLNIENLTITAEAVPSSNYSVFYANANSSSTSLRDVHLHSFGLNFKTTTQNFSVFALQKSGAYVGSLSCLDSRVILNVVQKGTTLFERCAVINSLITGRFDNVDGTTVKTFSNSVTANSVSGTNVFNLSSNAKLEYPSPKLSVYNSDLATFETGETAGNIVGCTAEELKNAEILRQKGFPVAVRE